MPNYHTITTTTILRKKEKEEKRGLLTHEYLRKSTDFQRLTGWVYDDFIEIR
jgi:hypothetical protein